MAAGSIVGTFIGGHLLGLIPNSVLLPMLAAILLYSPKGWRPNEVKQHSSPLPKIASVLHDNNQRLVPGSSAVHDQCLGACAGTFISGEMDEIGRDDSCFSGVQPSRGCSFDFHDKASFEHMK